nr:hypothetical protein [Leptolyngbyaceae cyanobacterium MO_188.B28]
GSLINKVSRNFTGVLADIHPVRVSGIKRGWYINIPEDRDTGLGAISDSASSCNGILMAANGEDFIALDSREKIHGYQRVKLPLEIFTFLDSETIRKIEIEAIWTYITDKIIQPTENCPIAQSYLDVVLEGCLSISDTFAEEFILSTYGWEFPWIDDRQKPRYRRPISADIERIDMLLKKLLPEAFIKRKVIN